MTQISQGLKGQKVKVYVMCHGMTYHPIHIITATATQV